MKYSHLLVSFMLVALQTGCASGPSTQAANKPKQSYDISYYLPKATFKVKTQYRLTSCESKLKLASGATEDKGPRLKINAEVERIIVVDNDMPYKYDFGAQSSGRKERDITVSLYANGTLKSINAVSEDKTGEIFSNIIGGIGSIFGLRALVGGGFQSMAMGDKVEIKPAAVNPCHKHIDDKIKEISELRKAINRLKKEQAGVDPSNGTGKQAKDRIDAYEAAINAATGRIAFLQTNFLTLKVKRTLDISDPNKTHHLSPSRKQLEKWFDEVGLASLTTQYAQKRLEEEIKTLTQPIFALEVAFLKKPDQITASVNEAESVITYREPFDTVIQICEQECPSKENDIKGNEILVNAQTSVPQWGRLKFLDFAVKTFEKRTVAYEFSSVGALQKATWKTNARGAAAASAFATSLDSARKATETALFGEDIVEAADLDRQVKYYENLKKLKDAKESYEKAIAAGDDIDSDAESGNLE